jgi:lysine biosynthesis protein LysW
MPKTINVREAVIECMDCGVKSVLTGRIELGQEIACPECGTWMEVVSLDPVQVDWVYDELDDDQEDAQEDW